MYRILKLFFLAAGLALCVLIVAGMDLAEVAGLVRRVGWGMAVLLGLYFLTFMLDTVSWQMTLAKLNGGVWLYRLFQVRLAGEAFNNTTPLAGFGVASVWINIGISADISWVQDTKWPT